MNTATLTTLRNEYERTQEEFTKARTEYLAHLTQAIVKTASGNCPCGFKGCTPEARTLSLLQRELR
jgi:hypothetical protein